MSTMLQPGWFHRGIGPRPDRSRAARCSRAGVAMAIAVAGCLAAVAVLWAPEASGQSIQLHVRYASFRAEDGLRINYNVPLDESSVPDADAFTVMDDGEPVAVSMVHVGGYRVRLEFVEGTEIESGSVVTVSYTRPSDESKRLKSKRAGGVDAPSFDNVEVITGHLVAVDTGFYAAGVTSDNTTVWVLQKQQNCDARVHRCSSKLAAYDLATRDRDTTKDITFASESEANPTALWISGDTMWIAGSWGGSKAVRAWTRDDMGVWSRDMDRGFPLLQFDDPRYSRTAWHPSNRHPGTNTMWSDGTTAWIYDIGTGVFLGVQSCRRFTLARS